MKQVKGFSLFEILLVMVIVGALIVMGTNFIQQRTTQARIDRTVMDMQQILNAAMSYYVANGSWPAQADSTAMGGTAIDGTLSSTSTLYQFRDTYLPKAATVGMPSPWPSSTKSPYYVMVSDVNSNLFYVYVQVRTGSHATSLAYAQAIAGRLPQGYVSDRVTSQGDPPNPSVPCGSANKSCIAVSAVNIPGQNLNNATAVNFVGLYHHGGCIPKPKCPVDANGNTMIPQVFVVPVSIRGVNNNTTGPENVSYPISSFSAYAQDAPASTPKAPLLCQGQSAVRGGLPGNTCSESAATYNGAPADGYWRACVQVITEKGDVTTTRSDTDPEFYWGAAQTVAAYTRCAISGESAGSNFQVYGD
jgi:prepilin-type N-terminal cleavage/methylation domain-containing protein